MGTAKNALCVILGGGGHARVVIDILQVCGAVTPYAILDRDRSLWNQQMLGVPILGGDELLPELVGRGVTHFVVAVGSVGSIGDQHPRRQLFEIGLAQGLAPLVVQHPTAVCSRFAQVGLGSVIFPTAVVNAGAFLGANVIVNTGAIVEHDCYIGDHAHIATGARLASTVRVGTGAHIGAGATLRQGVSIGEGAVVGAGAVVVRDVPPRVVVVGVPSRFLKEVGA